MPGLKTMVLIAGLLLILAGCSNSRSSVIYDAENKELYSYPE